MISDNDLTSSQFHGCFNLIYHHFDWRPPVLDYLYHNIIAHSIASEFILIHHHYQQLKDLFSIFYGAHTGDV